MGWVLKRTLAVFISWVGAGILIFAGMMTIGMGCGIGSGSTALIGWILFAAGLFLGILSNSLSRWLKIK